MPVTSLLCNSNVICIVGTARQEAAPPNSTPHGCWTMSNTQTALPASQGHTLRAKRFVRNLACSDHGSTRGARVVMLALSARPAMAMTCMPSVGAAEAPPDQLDLACTVQPGMVHGRCVLQS